MDDVVLPEKVPQQLAGVSRAALVCQCLVHLLAVQQPTSLFCMREIMLIVNYACWCEVLRLGQPCTLVYIQEVTSLEKKMYNIHVLVKL